MNSLAITVMFIIFMALIIAMKFYLRIRQVKKLKQRER